MKSSNGTALKLQLVGVPRIGADQQIRPRKAFQLLVLVALAPDCKFERASIAEHLWPGEPAKLQQDNLRPTLSRLRAELKSMGFPDLIEADPTHIWLSAHISYDLEPILTGKVSVWTKETDPFLQPLLSGWDDQVGNEIRARVELQLSRILLESLPPTFQSGDVWCNRIEKFVAIYPLNAAVVAAYYRHLVGINQNKRALEVLTAFEQLWVEEFGELDLPSIQSLTSDSVAPAPSKVRPIRKLWVLALVPVCIAGYTLVPKGGSGSAFSLKPILSEANEVVALSDEKSPQIYRINLETRKKEQVTHVANGVDDPYSGVNGKTVLFTSKVNGTLQVFRANLDGTGLVQLTKGKGHCAAPSESPDGKLVLFLRYDGVLGHSVCKLQSINANGVETTVLSVPRSCVNWAAYSPDGKQIAVEIDRGNFSKIYLLDPVTKKLSPQVFDSPGHQRRPTWTPDGKQILFTTDSAFVVWNPCIGDVHSRVWNKVSDSPKGFDDGWSIVISNDFVLYNENSKKWVKRVAYGRKIPVPVLDGFVKAAPIWR